MQAISDCLPLHPMTHAVGADRQGHAAARPMFEALVAEAEAMLHPMHVTIIDCLMPLVNCNRAVGAPLCPAPFSAMKQHEDIERMQSLPVEGSRSSAAWHCLTSASASLKAWVA